MKRLVPVCILIIAFSITLGAVAGYRQSLLYLASLGKDVGPGDGLATPIDMIIGSFWGLVCGGVLAFCFLCWQRRRQHGKVQ